MPVLPQSTQQAAADAEGGGFGALEPGRYVLRLVNVDTSKAGPKGPYWSWEFDVIEHSGRKVWVNMSLSDAAAWKTRECFDAFEAPLDTDVDTLCGQICSAEISQTTIQSGARQGQIGNNVDKLVPYDDATDRPESWGDPGEDEDF